MDDLLDLLLERPAPECGISCRDAWRSSAIAVLTQRQWRVPGTLRAGGLVATAVGALACGGSTPTSRDLNASAAIVYGRVTTAGGAAVGGATVRAKADDGLCGSGVWSGSGSPDVVTTNSTGAYRQRIVGFSRARYCVSVSALPPAGSGLDSATASDEVQFKDLRDIPYDSVRVDLRLP